MGKLHKIVLKNDRSIKIRMDCNFTEFRGSFYTNTAFLTQVASNHNILCTVQNWKENEEVRNLIYFSKERGDKCGRN